MDMSGKPLCICLELAGEVGLEIELWKGTGIFLVTGNVGVNEIKLGREKKRWQWRTEL